MTRPSSDEGEKQEIYGPSEAASMDGLSPGWRLGSAVVGIVFVWANAAKLLDE